jgi:sialate O-acetylesterase
LVRQSQQLLGTQRATIQEWQRAFAAYRQRVQAKEGKRPPPPADLPDALETARKLQNLGSLHEKYIEPLVPFAIAGSIWYQGESNANPRSLAKDYGDFLRALIDSRRRLWQNPQLPFYFVQLPAFDKQPTNAYWHLVREGMRRTYASTPETGMVVSYDVCDPSNLHPPEKQEVGRRLAWWALAKTYRQPIDYSGPLWRQARFADGVAILEFDHGEGLQASDSQPLRGFQVAGEDRQFQAASARIEGNSIILSSPLVEQPKSARFFFGGVERPNLVNAAGLPASPFTTLDGDE